MISGLAVFLTTGSIVSAQPVALFTPGRYKVCSGSNVTLINNSTGSNAYQWIVNNAFYSGNFNDSVTLYEPCYSLQSVQLIATNTISGLSDTMTRILEVFDTCAPHYTGDFTNCIGDTILLKANTESISNHWDIQPATPLIAGCNTCDSVMFVLMTMGTTVDLHSVYEGDCSQNTSFHYGWCNPFVTAIPENNPGKFEVYPNPVSDKLVIQNNTSKKLTGIELLNEQGVLMRKSEGEIKSIDLSSLPGGLYFLILKDAEGMGVKKIIKQKKVIILKVY